MSNNFVLLNQIIEKQLDELAKEKELPLPYELKVHLKNFIRFDFYDLLKDKEQELDNLSYKDIENSSDLRELITNAFEYHSLLFYNETFLKEQIVKYFHRMILGEDNKAVFHIPQDAIEFAVKESRVHQDAMENEFSDYYVWLSVNGALMKSLEKAYNFEINVRYVDFKDVQLKNNYTDKSSIMNDIDYFIQKILDQNEYGPHSSPKDYYVYSPQLLEDTYSLLEKIKGDKVLTTDMIKTAVELTLINSLKKAYYMSEEEKSLYRLIKVSDYPLEHLSVKLLELSKQGYQHILGMNREYYILSKESKSLSWDELKELQLKLIS